MRRENFLSRYSSEMAQDIDDRIRRVYNELRQDDPDFPELIQIVENNINSMLCQTVPAQKSKPSTSFTEDTALQYLDNTIIVLEEKKFKSIKNKRVYCTSKFYKDFEDNLKKYQKNQSTDGTQFSGMAKPDIDYIVKSVENWREAMGKRQSLSNMDKVYLTSYPLIHYYDRKMLVKCFHTDIAFNIAQLSKQPKYSDFVQATPSLGFGTYSGDNFRKRTVYMQSYDEEINAALEAGIDMQYSPSFRGDISGPYEEAVGFKPFKLNEKCREIISYYTKKTIEKFRFNYANNITAKQGIRVDASMYEICCLMYPNRKSFTVDDYIRATQHVLNVAYFRFNIKTAGQLRSIAFVDELVLSEGRETSEELVETADDETRTVPYRFLSITVGEAILRNVLSGDLSFVITNQLNELDSPLEKLLYTALRTDRIYDLSLGADNNNHCYSLIQLQMAASVSGSKKVKKAKYQEALKHLQEKGILIEGFAMIDEDFYVRWVQLSESEKRDIFDTGSHISPSAISDLTLEMDVQSSIP